MRHIGLAAFGLATAAGLLAPPAAHLRRCGTMRLPRAPPVPPARQRAIRPAVRIARPLMATAVAAVDADVAAKVVDVAVVGGGPAGTLMSYLLAERQGLSVLLIDAAPERAWPNNYGVWQQEWDALERMLDLGLDDCVDHRWATTDCFFGGSWEIPLDARTKLPRAYARVDRNALKKRLRSPQVEVLASTVDARAVAPNIFEGGLAHDAAGSTLTCADGTVVRAALVVDATGAESTLVRRGAPPEAPGSGLTPGFQIAYGFEATVDSEGGLGPYDENAMLLFDYRTDHLEAADPAWAARAGHSAAGRRASDEGVSVSRRRQRGTVATAGHAQDFYSDSASEDEHFAPAQHV